MGLIAFLFLVYYCAVELWPIPRCYFHAAERALDTMNYTLIKEKPCRIMWSQRDPAMRKVCLCTCTFGYLDGIFFVLS